MCITALALRQSKGGYLVWRAIVTLGLGAGLVPGELNQVAALEIRQCLDLQVMEAEALLQGRLESEQKGMKLVYDELRFLHSLCEAVQKGEFIPNLAIKVAEGRVQRQQLQAPEAVPREQPSAE